MWAHGRNRKVVDAPVLGTIWAVPDALSARITPVLAELDPPRRGGQHRIDQRAAPNAIINDCARAAGSTLAHGLGRL